MVRVGKISSALVFHCVRCSCCLCWQSRVSSIVIDTSWFGEAAFGQTPNSRVCQRGHVSHGSRLQFRTKVRRRATPTTTRSMSDNRQTWAEVAQPYFSPGLRLNSATHSRGTMCLAFFLLQRNLGSDPASWCGRHILSFLHECSCDRTLLPFALVRVVVGHRLRQMEHVTGTQMS